MSSPNDKISYGTNIFGNVVHVGRRTAAHLDYTKKRLAQKYPRCQLQIVQGGFNTSIAASAGTHDYDACVDVRIEGLGWWEAQSFLRQCGWAAWYRHAPLFSYEHIHMISLGYGNATVGALIPEQVNDYYNHAFGLANLHSPGLDHSWFPSNIRGTIFNYDAYLKSLEPKLNEVQKFRAAIAAALKAENIPANRAMARAMVRAIRFALAAGPKS